MGASGGRPRGRLDLAALACALLTIVGMLAPATAQAPTPSVPSLQEVDQCEFGGQVGLDCTVFGLVDSIDGAQFNPGCSGFRDPTQSFCVPGEGPFHGPPSLEQLDECDSSFHGDLPDVPVEPTCILLLIADSELGVIGLGHNSGDPSPVCVAKDADPACYVQDAPSPPPCATNLPPTVQCLQSISQVNTTCVLDGASPTCAVGCLANTLWASGRGAVNVGGDQDVTPGTDAINGFCPGPAPYDESLTGLTLDGSKAAASTNPLSLSARTPPLLSISATTKNLLVRGAHLLNPPAKPALVLDNAKGVTLRDLDASGLDLKVSGGSVVLLDNVRLGSLTVNDSQVAIVGGQLDGGSGPVLRTGGASNVTLLRTTIPGRPDVVDATGGSLRIESVRFAGTAPSSGPCFQAHGLDVLQVVRLSANLRCPGGIVNGTADLVAVDGLAGESSASAPYAARLVAGSFASVVRSSLKGGAAPLRLEGAGAARWGLANVTLDGGSAALVSLGPGLGNGTITSSVLRGGAPLLQADFAAPATPALRTGVRFANNQVTRTTPERVAAAGSFDDRVALVLARTPPLPVPNIRGGPLLAGNWWDRTGTGLFDGNGDGLAETAFAIGGTNATDPAALVPVNQRPSVFAAPQVDLGDPFVHLFPGSTISFTGSAVDPEDGVLDVAWSLDGQARGTGPQATFVVPSAGPHTVTATATDSQGAFATQDFTIRALPRNPAPSLTNVRVAPCSPDVPPTVGQPLCLHADTADQGGDDPLDALYLDTDADAKVGANDLRLSRLADPAVDPGLVGNSFGLGAALVPYPAATLVARAGQAWLDLAGDGVGVGDLRLGPTGTGSRILAGDPDAGQPASPLPCGLALGVVDSIPYADLDCSGKVSVGDLRLAPDPAGPLAVGDVQASDAAVGSALTRLAGTVGRYDRDAAVTLLWSLDVGTAHLDAAGTDARIVPTQAGQGLLTVVAQDQGEPVGQNATTRVVRVFSDQPPVPQMALAPSDLRSGGIQVSREAPVLLVDQSRAQAATPIVNLTWAVTEGGATSLRYGPSPTYTFHVLGDASVKLTALAANGLSASIMKTVTVLQAPPTPDFEVTAADPQPAGTTLWATALGSLDSGSPLRALGSGLQRLGVAGGSLLLDIDGDAKASAGDLVLGTATAPSLLAATDALAGTDLGPAGLHACFTDLDGNGVPSRGRGIEPVFLAASCTSTQAGDVRLQPGPRGEATETFLAPGDSDVGLGLLPIPAARLGLHELPAPQTGVPVLDVDGDGKVSAGDIRLVAADGRPPTSRVLPPARADGGGSLTYEWTCLVGCGAGQVGLGNQLPQFPFRFDTSGRKVLELAVTDASGNTAREQQSLVVLNQAPQVGIQASDATGATSGFTDLTDIQFDGRPSHDVDGPDAGLSYHWTFGDGDSADGAVVAKRFAGPGTYTVTLDVTDSDDVAPATGSAVLAVHVANALPVPAIQFAPTLPTTLAPVAFDGHGSVDLDGSIPATGYLWTFTEGSTVTQQTGALASHAFARSGSYPVRLEVTDDRGDRAATTQVVTVLNQAPQARLDLNRTIALPPAAIQFDSGASTDPETGGAAQLSMLWEFGDGATSTEANPVHVYTQRGTFVVRLTVFDPDGGSDTATASVTLLNEPARLSVVLPAQGQVRQDVSFKALAFDPEGDALTFMWDFGDGATATGAEQTHQFARPGFYTVQARVVDAGGAQTAVTRTLEILGTAPIATLSVDKATVRVGETLRVHGTGSDPDPDGHVVGHFLDFGDGASTFAANATHAYAQPGTYTITYRATDETGLAGQAKANVTVTNPPPTVAPILATPSDPHPGDILFFRANVTERDPGMHYTWDFKDGTVSEQATPIHVYRLAGQFNVELTVRNSLGAETTRLLEVNVVERGATATTGNGTADTLVPASDGTLDAVRQGQRGAPAPAAPLVLVALVALTALAARRRRA